MKIVAVVMIVIFVCQAASSETLSGEAAALFARAHDGRFYADSMRLHPDIEPTSDGRSFVVIWKAAPRPRRWIVSLHGSHGFATEDLAVWHRHLEGREVGLICIQWWKGGGEATADYYTPREIYREADAVLRRLGVGAGQAMLHGFSRGSANVYAVMALDAKQRHFSLAVADSGGVALDYPPIRAIDDGDYGDHPLRGTRWVTVAGGRDPHPERDGIPAMRRTADWLRHQGATVICAIEDEDGGHGAFHRSMSNARRVLDLFLGG